MALSLSISYNDDFGRVQISFTGGNADADSALVEHSLDQINWSTIRGGDAVPVSAGSGHIDHYDGYVFGVPNYYRVSTFDDADPALFGTGTLVTANNASLNPGLPGGTIPNGAQLVAFVSHFNTGVTIGTPAGWTRLSSGGANVAMFYREYQAGVTAPTFTFTGGVAGDSCQAVVRAFTNVQIPVHLQFQSNTAAQNVAYPAAAVPSDIKAIWLLHLWKQSATTGAGAPAGFINQMGASNTAGANNETGLEWTTANNIVSLSAGVSTWSGGTSAISRARIAYLPQRGALDSGNISLTPQIPNPNAKPYWLMNPARPGQNVRVEITDFSEISQEGRTGIFEILGRTFPVIISDFMTSGAFTFSMDAANKSESKELAGRIAVGEPMYLLSSDPEDDVDTFYFTATSLKRQPDAKRSSWTVTVTAREVAQPAPAVYGSTYIWSDIVTDYASWSTVVADPANTSWSQVVDKVSNDIIVVP